MQVANLRSSQSRRALNAPSRGGTVGIAGRKAADMGSPYSEAAARNPAMTMTKATDNQMSSVGIKEIMVTRSGADHGGDHALYPLVSQARGSVQSFSPLGEEKWARPPQVHRGSGEGCDKGYEMSGFWLPFLDAYRTRSLAPNREIRMVFSGLRRQSGLGE